MYNIQEPSSKKRTVNVIARFIKKPEIYDTPRHDRIKVGQVFEGVIEIYPGLSLKYSNWIKVSASEMERITENYGTNFGCDFNNSLFFEDAPERDCWELVTDISPGNPFAVWNRLKYSRGM